MLFRSAPGAGKRIVILGLMLIPDAVAAAIEIESGTTDIIPIFDLAADTPLVLPPGPVPWLVCTANEALNVTADAAINGVVLYVVETV